MNKIVDMEIFKTQKLINAIDAKHNGFAKYCEETHLIKQISKRRRRKIVEVETTTIDGQINIFELKEC